VRSETEHALTAPRGSEWWRTAVIYQVYLRSFADGDGDGTGDLTGARSKLRYLADLGVDAIWFTPWYLSPMADGGYDVADYRQIAPAFGNLAGATALIAEAAALGIRTIVDVVPNHVSEQHDWFTQALAAEPGSPARNRFWFRPGRGHNGSDMPTDWVSNFGGTTWTRTKNADGTPGEWYLHLFAPQQPDLNWTDASVRTEHEDILRFWFDRGAAGVRIDSAGLLVKDPALPEVPEVLTPGGHPYEDRDELHQIYRSWRAIADSYDEPRVLVGELWLPEVERFARYLRPDELHTAFNFDFLACPWDAVRLRASISQTLAGAPATWVLANHDVTRAVTRYGRADTAFAFADKRADTPTDRDLGHRRARAAALLAMALPGSFYLYQGEELGLPEVEDIPEDRLQDPMHFRSGGLDPGRDGCRVPLPWSGTEPPYGFGTNSQTWLPQPADWAALTAEAQLADPTSMLSLYRAALSIRRRQLHTGDFGWLPSPDTVLYFGRSGGFTCVVNLGPEPIPLPEHDHLLLASSDVTDGSLPSDAAAWLLTHPTSSS
jgi:alpha-glucosidase